MLADRRATWRGIASEVAIDVVGLGWLGTRAPHAAALVDFHSRVLGLRMAHAKPRFWAFTLPDGHNVEIFDLTTPARTTLTPVR
jgi:hypothetical protein